MYRPLVPPVQRKGIILLVVLALLTLFTIVGISFVLYADAAATQARVAKDSNVKFQPEMEPEEGLSLFLDQFIFDVRDDESGVYSSLRGHSLVRNMYGFNYTWADTAYGTGVPPSTIVQTGNDTPFSGIGRLHYPGPTALGQVDDYTLVNYMYYNSYSNNGTPASDPLRDPERYGFRTALRAPGAMDNRGPYLASANVPYTYPDLNNFYLGAINSYGNLITQSFHRGWLFGPLYDPANPQNPQNNPNWTNAVGKYLTLRPRPNENPGFPYPADAGGDVKNLIGYPGGNDSIWIDIGAPVLTTPDGTKYKMLIAPLILDLDGRVNLNVHGNMAGQDPSIPLALANGPHISMYGLGPWEVNLGPNSQAILAGVSPTGVLTANSTEWQKLFTGVQASPKQISRYGPYSPSPNTSTGTLVPGVPLQGIPSPSAPAATNNLAPSVLPATETYYKGFHPYGQFDYRGQAQSPPAMPLAPISATLGTRSAFPIYSNTFHNSDVTDLQDHPVLYNPFTPLAPNTAYPGYYYNRRFRSSNLERLFRWGNAGSASGQTGLKSGDTGIEELTSELERLLPNNFNSPSASNAFPSFRRRNLVTLHSGDRLQPGMSPYVFTPAAPTPVTTPAAATQAPVYTAPAFPTPATSPPSIPPGSDFTQYGVNTGWQSAIINSSVTGGQALWRLDLNNPFANIPASVASTVLAGRTATTPYLTPYPTVKTATTVDQQRYDQDAYVVQFQQAQFDRQWLARQIYLRLLAVTGLTPAGANPGSPTPAELQVRRWYGQLAVNMVDYLDNDDISTAFNFYSPLDVPGLSVATQTTTVSADGATNPAYWVFGTELPRVLLNEAMIEYPAPTTPAPTAGTTFPNNIWVELFNPLDNATTNTSVGNSNVTTVDSQSPVPLAMQALPGGTQTGANGAIPGNTNSYAAYQVVIADQMLQVVQPTTYNDNVLGLPNATRAATTIIVPSTTNTTAGQFGPGSVQSFTATNTLQPVNNPLCPSACLPPQQYMVVGPSPFQDAHSTMGVKPTLATGLLTAGTQIVSTANMQYNSTYNTPPTTYTPNDSTTGQTILLRRLANPHIPYNTTINLPGQPTVPNPWYNPYVTIDYIQSVPLNNTASTTVTKWTSVGKKQPYAAYTPPSSPSSINSGSLYLIAPQINNAGTAGTKHTFGQANNPLPTSRSGAYAWLTHLDRQLTSPLELLHVSQYQPYQLTQQFMLEDAFQINIPVGAPQYTYMHAPLSTWFTQNTRLYRLFELLQTNYQQFGSTDPFRSTGKINLNSIWDLETFMALCDPQPGNYFGPTDVQTAWYQLLSLRSPSYNYSPPLYQGTVSAADAPFLGLAPGYQPATTAPSGQYSQFPQGQGIANTILGPSNPNLPQGGTQLFDYPSWTQGGTVDNPYVRTELVRKLFNNTTSRSNAFGVWVTVGYFQVTNVNTSPVQLGAEMNAVEGRRIRHRMFAIVDRSGLQLNPYPSVPATPPSSLTGLPTKTPFLPGSPPAWTRTSGAPPTSVTTNLTGVVPYWAIID